MNVAEALSVGGWPPPTIALIMYEPPGSVVAGTVKVLTILPLLFETAGLSPKSTLPFAVSQNSCTVVPAGKKFDPVIVACCPFVSVVGEIEICAADSDKSVKVLSITVVVPSSAHTGYVPNGVPCGQ